MEHRLFYTKKAKVFEEALPLGNGRLGAMVFGNLKTERIALNEDTLWSGYPKEQNKKDAYRSLPKLREAVLSGNHREAARISNEEMHGVWSECYLPFGDLIIEYKGKKGLDYRRELDISKGVAVASDSRLTETVFVSHPAQMIVVHIKAPFGVSFDVKLASQLKHRVYTAEDRLVMEGEAPETCYPVYYHDDNPVRYGDSAMKFCGAVAVLGNATFEKDYISVKDQTETTLFISLATSFVDFKSMPNADARARAFAHFGNIAGFQTVLQNHLSDFERLYRRVDLELGTERAYLPTDKRLLRFQKHPEEDNNFIALLFQYGRYLTVSCSREETTAMNLQGIFNEKMRAPWSSNYTTNINTQMNYWCTDICNLSECFKPFIEQTFHMVETGRKTAGDYYRCKGSCAHHNSDIWAMSRPAGDPKAQADAESYAPWPSSLPWMLCQVFEHYRYTEDSALFERMKPYFKEVLDFYYDFLFEYNGALVTCPSISPENTYIDGGEKASLTYMPTMDIGILEEFFADCRALGFKTPEIPPVPIGADGRIMEWQKEYEEADPEHRHVSHLYCVYPSAVEQSEAVKKACKKSLLTRGFGGTGWSLGWKVCLWARLGNAENAVKLIQNQLYPIHPNKMTNYHHGGSYPNLFDAHPPFQIDGNFGVAAGIAELFKNGAIPKNWTGYVKGLQLYGGKTLNIKFENGKII